jgi:hypothetical protein
MHFFAILIDLLGLKKLWKIKKPALGRSRSQSRSLRSTIADSPYILRNGKENFLQFALFLTPSDFL